MIRDPDTRGEKPSIVIIPGAFSPDLLYFDVVNQLHENGYEAVVETLPSSSRAPSQKAATLAEDAAFAHDIVEKVADQGKDVVIVTHAYGGVVGTECVKGLVKTEREEADKHGGVIRVVYLNSVVLTPGNSLNDLSADIASSFIEVEGDFLKLVVGESAKFVFSDLPLQEATEWNEKMSYHSRLTFEGKATYPGYNYVPVSFIVCENDAVMPMKSQLQIIETIEKESGETVDVHTLKAGHCPNVSAPSDVAKAIMAAVSMG